MLCRKFVYVTIRFAGSYGSMWELNNNEKGLVKG